MGQPRVGIRSINARSPALGCERMILDLQSQSGIKSKIMTLPT